MMRKASSNFLFDKRGGPRVFVAADVFRREMDLRDGGSRLYGGSRAEVYGGRVSLSESGGGHD